VRPVFLLLCGIILGRPLSVSAFEAIEPSRLSESELESLMGVSGTERYDEKLFPNYEMVVSKDPFEARLDGKVQPAVYRGLQNRETKKLVRWTGMVLPVEWAKAIREAGQGVWEDDARYFSLAEDADVVERASVRYLVGGKIPKVRVGDRELNVVYAGLASALGGADAGNYRFLSRKLRLDGKDRRIRLGHLFPGMVRQYPFSEKEISRLNWPGDMITEYTWFFSKVGE